MNKTISILGMACMLAGSVAAQEQDSPLDPISLVGYVEKGNPYVNAAEKRVDVERHRVENLNASLTTLTPTLEQGVQGSDIAGSRQFSQKTMLGLQKHFFDGSSFFLGSGLETSLIDGGRTQYFEFSGSLPIGSSFQEVQRRVANARNENFFQEAQTRYVDTLKWQAWIAQRAFYRLKAAEESERLTTEAIADLKERGASEAIIADEVSALETQLGVYEAAQNEMLTSLRQQIGRPLPEIADFDLYDHEKYTDPYLAVPIEEVLYRAKRNDLSSDILDSARDVSLQRLELTRKAGWDMRTSGRARYDFERDDYLGFVEFSIAKVDKDLLANRISEAQAEIDWYDAEIFSQRASTRQVILVEIGNLQSLIGTAESLRENVLARKQTYETKVENGADLNDLIDLRLRQLDQAIGAVDKFLEVYMTVATLDRVCGTAYLGNTPEALE